MAVKVAAQIIAGDQVRQFAAGGGFNLAPVLAQFRRNPLKAKRFVNVLLLGCGDAPLPRNRPYS